jgi:hypothetical protein
LHCAKTIFVRQKFALRNAKKFAKIVYSQVFFQIHIIFKGLFCKGFCATLPLSPPSAASEAASGSEVTKTSGGSQSSEKPRPRTPGAAWMTCGCLEA